MTNKVYAYLSELLTAVYGKDARRPMYNLFKELLNNAEKIGPRELTEEEYFALEESGGVLPNTTYYLADANTIMRNGEQYGNSVTETSEFIYDTSNNKQSLIIYYGSATSIKIASTIDGLPVDSLLPTTFSGDKKLSKVEIPDSVTSIY